MKTTQRIERTVLAPAADEAREEQIQEYWESRSGGGAMCRAVMVGILLAFCLWAASRADATGMRAPGSGWLWRHAHAAGAYRSSAVAEMPPNTPCGFAWTECWPG